MLSRLRSRPDRLHPKRALGLLWRILPAWLLAAGSARGAELPAYFSAAVARFTAGAPPGWAYTLAVSRGDETSVECYDPSRPAGRQWTLLKRNDRPPTPDETDRYQRYRETNNAIAAARATFERGDLDFASAQILREDATSATIRCQFRSDVAEPMLGHLELFLSVAKNPAAVQKSTLRLTKPYSPVLGMKMNALDVETTFSLPADGHPGLPVAVVSRFHGRILWFWPVDEDLRVSYSEYRRVVPSADRAEPR